MKRLHRSVCLFASLVILPLLAITAFTPAASAGTCPTARWVPVPKMDYLVPAYPEENTTYWVFDFYTFQNMKLEIKGQFPYARYMNLVLYDYNGGEVATYSYGENHGINEMQVIEDRDIVPDTGSYNPSQPDVERYNDEQGRNYTVYVVREDNYVVKDDGSMVKERINPDGSPMENTLVIPSDLEVAAVFLRVYMPDNKNNAQGDVPLPKISVTNLNNGLGSPCPPQQIAGPDKLAEILLGPVMSEEDYSEEDQQYLEYSKIYTFNPGPGWGLYANGNNPYLIAPLWHWTEQVATMKFKAPTFTRTREQSPGVRFGKDDEVRYFSVCMGGYAMTNTSECISDEDLKIDADGYVRIAVVPNGEKIKYIFDPVWNVFSWGQHQYPAVLFRQIGVNPDFENSFFKTEPAFSADEQPSMEEIVSKRASEKIHEYAPEGIYCNLYEFEENRCGM